MWRGSGPGGGGGGAAGGAAILVPLTIPAAVPTAQDLGASDAGLGRAIYVGRAHEAYTGVDVVFEVTREAGATAFDTDGWAECAIYKASNINLGNSATLTRCGSENIASDLGATGVASAGITTAGIAAGDDLYIVFAARIDGAAQIPQIKGAATLPADDTTVLEFNVRPSATASDVFSIASAAGYIAFQAFGSA